MKMGDMNKNFSRYEFSCPCGCGFDTADYMLVIVVQDVRDHFDERTVISCGCRCKMHNITIGGSLFSQHMYGRAADIVVNNVHPDEVYKYLDKKYKGKFGVGGYNHHTHIDTRSGTPWRETGMISK